MRRLTCLRCQTPMSYLRDEKLQLGQTGWVLGDLPNLLAGAMEVSIYACPNCGKIEFFRVEDAPIEDAPGDDHIAQVRCPRCGKLHDMDYPKCPFCKYPE